MRAAAGRRRRGQGPRPTSGPRRRPQKTLASVASSRLQLLLVPCQAAWLPAQLPGHFAGGGSSGEARRGQAGWFAAAASVRRAAPPPLPYPLRPRGGTNPRDTRLPGPASCQTPSRGHASPLGSTAGAAGRPTSCNKVAARRRGHAPATPALSARGCRPETRACLCQSPRPVPLGSLEP